MLDTVWRLKLRNAQGNVLAIYQKKDNNFVWKEQHLYGSSRLGIFSPDVKIQGTYVVDVAALQQSVRAYELTNHLGNVLSTITDKGVITSAQDYFPFGLTLASRSFTEGGSSYRFGFNGMEHDRELKQQDYKNRINRPDLGRFLSVDPLTKDYPQLTPYQFASNSPIQAIDLDGLEGKVAVSGTGRNDKDLSLKTSSDNNQFRTEAELAKKKGIITDIIPASKDEPIISGYDMITQLEDYSKTNKGIEFLMILSHGAQGRLLINNEMASKPSAFVTTDDNKPVTGTTPSITYETIPLSKLAKNKNITFTKDALVVFAGCNTGCRLTDFGDAYKAYTDYASVAEYFTGYSGVPSIGSMGSTYPKGDVRKVQDDKATPFKEGYYLFQKNSDKTVSKTWLGDSLTEDVISKAKEISKPK